MGVALAEAGILCWIKSGVHACENREASSRRQSETCFVAESFGVLAIRGENFIEDLAHVIKGGLNCGNLAILGVGEQWTERVAYLRSPTTALD